MVTFGNPRHQALRHANNRLVLPDDRQPFKQNAGKPFPFHQGRTPEADENKTTSKADYYHLIRNRIENEDNLINQRLIWMVFSQSFLFSAFAVLLNAPEKAKNMIFSTLQDTLLWVIPCIGMCASSLIYIGLLISLMTVRKLRNQYKQYPDDHSADHFPPIQNTKIMRFLAALPPLLLPVIFFITWVAILIFRLTLKP